MLGQDMHVIPRFANTQVSELEHRRGSKAHDLEAFHDDESNALHLWRLIKNVLKGGI
jgi:hypothetical protein